MATERNGDPTWRDLGRLEDRQRVLEEGQRWLSRMGERHNEQLNTLREDVADMKGEVALVPIAVERADQALAGWKSVRTALYTAGGGFVLLALSILATGGSG